MGKWLNGMREVCAATAAVALQTEMDTSKERLVTVEEALDLLLSGVTE